MDSGCMDRTIIVHVALAMASNDGQGRSGAALVLSTSRPNAVSAMTSCVKRPGHQQRGQGKRAGGGGGGVKISAALFPLTDTL